MYLRPNAAQAYDSFERAYKGDGTDLHTITGTVAASAAALPQLSGAVVQQYVSADRFGNTVVCSGTIQAFNTDTYGILMTDTVASGTAQFAYAGKFSLRLDSGLTPLAGIDAYIITASMLVTTVGGSGKIYIGKFTGAKTTDPAGRPAGDYATVQLFQTEI